MPEWGCLNTHKLHKPEERPCVAEYVEQKQTECIAQLSVWWKDA